MVLPNLVIAGVNKAGTTTLFDALAAHPEVGASRVKETCHWLPLRYDEPQATLAEYERHFPSSSYPVVMEATPGYFYGGERIAPAIRGSLPGARVLIVLREPVDRLMSFFRFQKSMLKLPPEMTVEQYVVHCRSYDTEQLVRDRTLNPWFGVEGGQYSRYLPDWMHCFGERLKVVDFTDLARDQDQTLREIGSWLDLDPDGWESVGVKSSNRTVSPRNRRIHGVALAVNRRLEGVLRSAPELKVAARRAYHRLNATDFVEAFPVSVRNDLSDLYREDRRSVGQLLDGFGTKVPDWCAVP